MSAGVDPIAKKLSLGRPFHGPAGKPAVKRSRRNSNKFSGGGGRRVKSKSSGMNARRAIAKARAVARMERARAGVARRLAEKKANKKRGPAGPNFNPPQREPGHNWSGGGGRRRK